MNNMITERIMNNRISILVLGAAVLLSASCEKIQSGRGNAVSFSTGISSTKTSYNSSDVWLIEWLENDKIKVHSEECYGPLEKEATYKIAPGTISNESDRSKGDFLPEDENAQLYWDADPEANHTFSAVYPAGKGVWSSGDIFTFPVPINQNNADGFMENCYLVARNTNVKNTLAKGSVLLSFKPIMTTLEVTVQGATEDASLDRTLSHIDFTTAMPCDGENKFAYNTASETATTATKSTTIVWTPTDDTKSIAGSATAEPNKLKFNVFIPYVEISSSNKVQIDIYFKDETSTDQHYTATLNPSSPITAGAKKKIVLPTLMKKSYIGEQSLEPFQGEESDSNDDWKETL